MKPRVFVLSHATARYNAAEAVKTAPEGYAVVIRGKTRSLDMNAAQWPILRAFSEQKHWPVNGELVKLSEEEWKDILTAAFMRETTRVAKGLDGGMVMLGWKTSEFSGSKFSEWLEFLNATAADFDIVVPARGG